MEENRFSGAIWAQPINNYRCVIVGLGATGSYLSFFLARAGVKYFYLVDFDIYNPINIGSQLAEWADVGVNKTEAVEQKLYSYSSPNSVITYETRIQEEDWLLTSYPIICCTLDSMEGRKFMFEQFLNNQNRHAIFFDTRIGAEYWEVYIIPKGNQEKIDRYKETLFGEEQGNTGACNYQQSSHSAAGAAIKVTELLTNWITNIITEDDYLPFKITMDIRTQNYGIYY